MSWNTPVSMSVTCGEGAAEQDVFQARRERFPLDSALKYLMVKSANDVAVAIAEAVSGSEEAFVQ
jgi:D-alanyl-D-alanine carboxypeptidase